MSFLDRIDNRRLAFGSNEVTGAIGDSITVLPIVVALGLVTGVSVSHVLLAFGIFQIVWGIRYGLPVSVEPMKALAALAIAGTLTYAELATAGMILGVVLLVIGLGGVLATVERWIGTPVVRGVQFAVGMLLVETGLQLASEGWVLAGVGSLIVVVLVCAGSKNVSALVVLAVGIGIALGTAGLPAPHWPGPPPASLTFGITWATVDSVVAQLAMTIGNAALASSLLIADRFGEEITPDELSTSMGTTNLVVIPIGGIPMCHGCDGIAGKHEFGARTGGANVVGGMLYLGIAFFTTAPLLRAFPLAMLGVLLVIVGTSLATSVLQSTNRSLSVAIGVVAIVVNLGVAFVVGILAHLALKRTTAEN
ncbi:putative sulfate/molybdate transporter [Halocatena salina]|uniref:Putative sulfate/molybdate transporter n=1 Tax=Halocatena salina TaxID=2934340 RepID=A0A8U0A484_9EURY|nr:putative sulfate/molybdate transporter [Halocatena salina]UPM42737.1 putative sulfate/molybdate transporter [Halocatena salina]